MGISAINIKWMGASHVMDGMAVRDKRFKVSIPFANKTHSDMLTDSAGFRAQEAKPIVVKGISVAAPFILTSTSPNTPVTVKPDERVTFELQLEAPSYKYDGPLNVSFLSDMPEMVHVEISAVKLICKDRSIEIEKSSRILNLQKGQVFTESVQLLKAVSYGSRVERISVSQPFGFAGSEPKLPFTINDTNSFIAHIYVQAPESGYAGEMEIHIE